MVWRQREEITRLLGIKCMRCLESVKTAAFWNDRQLGQVSYILPKRCNLQFGRKTGRDVHRTGKYKRTAHIIQRACNFLLDDFIISSWQKLSWTTTLRPPHPDLIWIRGQSCTARHKCTLCTLSPSSLTDWCNLGLVHHLHTSLQHHPLQTSVSYNSSPNPWFYFTYLHTCRWVFLRAACDDDGL